MADTESGPLAAPAERALVDLIPHRFDPRVRNLLAAALGVSADAVVQQELDAYIDAPMRRLLGFLENRVPVALIGLDFIGEHSAIVLHVAVAQEERRAGIGRQMVWSAAARYGLERMSAAGDPVSAGFFRTLGFCVRSVGETLPGLERFECVWHASMKDDDDGG
ncbi:MAG: GNAT family N-acetyltransferase [Gammaproteobacteria bacterium]|nr:MAG: GNAT family N-acetyltransferase [Gammaproteobacteria bacterium]